MVSSTHSFTGETLLQFISVTAVIWLQIRFVLLLSRQGKVRLAKWYSTYTQKERAKVGLSLLLKGLLSSATERISGFNLLCFQQVIRDVTPLVLGRPLKLCNFLDWKDNKASRLQSRLFSSFGTELTGRCMHCR